jgi:hypothetical protein
VAGRLEFAERAMSTPLALRLVTYVTALTVTAGIYLWTRSETLQLLAFAIVCVVIVPLLDRFVMPGAAAATEQDDYKPSRRLVVAGPLLFLAWGVGAIFLLPDLGLGFAVWILVVVVPAAEFYRWLVERERRSKHGESFATR